MRKFYYTNRNHLFTRQHVYSFFSKFRMFLYRLGFLTRIGPPNQPRSQEVLPLHWASGKEYQTGKKPWERGCLQTFGFFLILHFIWTLSFDEELFESTYRPSIEMTSQC